MVTIRDKIALYGNVDPALITPTGAVVTSADQADVALIDWAQRHPELNLWAWRKERGLRPAIAIVGRTRLADRRAAHDAGADDVLADPSNTADLIRLIDLHREQPDRSPTQGIPAIKGPLGRNEREILRLLKAAGGKVVSEHDLIASCWQLADLNGRGKLRVAINRLRRALEPEPEWPHLIVNEPGLGYRLWPSAA